jgi:hypothetical protein
VTGGVLWVADSNHRATPNYANAISGLVIPSGYSKFVDVKFTFAADKSGGGTDQYLFQLETDGVTQGIGIAVTLTGSAQTVSLFASFIAAVGTSLSVGLAVTGGGTNDDIDMESFEMSLVDFQPWTDPT